MEVLLEAAMIAEARFGAPLGAPALALMARDPITGTLTWKNNTLPPGEMVKVGYVFGDYDPVTEGFTLLTFVYDGVAYCYGSVRTATAPAQGASQPVDILSYAPEVAALRTLDALCFVDAGTLGGRSADFGVGLRMTGLNVGHFLALDKVATRVFQDALTVSPFLAAVEITTFSLLKA